MAGPKIVFEMVHISIGRDRQGKRYNQEFWRERFVYLQTHLLIQAISTVNKELLSRSDTK